MNIVTRLTLAFALVFVLIVSAPAAAQVSPAVPVSSVEGSLDRADLVVIGGWASSPTPDMNHAVVRIVGRFYNAWTGQEHQVVLAEDWAMNFRPDVGYKSFTFPSPAWWFKGWKTRVCAQVYHYGILDKYGNPTPIDLPGCKTIIARMDDDARPSVKARILGTNGRTLDPNNEWVQVSLRRTLTPVWESSENPTTGNCSVNMGEVSCWEGKTDGAITLGEDYHLVVSASGYETRYLEVRNFQGNVDLGDVVLEPLKEVTIFQQVLLGRRLHIVVDIEQYLGDVELVLQVHGSSGPTTEWAVYFDAEKRRVGTAGRSRHDFLLEVPADFPVGNHVSYRVVMNHGGSWKPVGFAYGSAFIER